MNTINKVSTRSFFSFLRQHQLIIFFVVTLLLSAGIAAVAIVIGDKNITILSVFTPSLVAIALTALVGGRSELKNLLVKQMKQHVEYRWVVISLITFPILAILAISMHSLFGGSELTLRTTQLLPQMIVIVLIALGEEYGWRGYALPKLEERYNALTASLILGLVWGFWHFPGYLIGVGVPLDMPFYVFMLWVLAATILITWVYNNTRSVLMAMLMHIAANATFNYLSLLPEFTGQIVTFWLFLGLVSLASIAVVAVFGASHLIRHSEPHPGT